MRNTEFGNIIADSCPLKFCLLPAACFLSFEKSMPRGGTRLCASSSIEKTRVFDPHMSARWAHHFYARFHFEKSYPGGAVVKCWLAHSVKTSLFRETLFPHFSRAPARATRPEGPKVNSRGRESTVDDDVHGPKV